MIVRNFELINHLVIHLLVNPNKNIVADQILLFNYSFIDSAFILRILSAHKLVIYADLRLRQICVGAQHRKPGEGGGRALFYGLYRYVRPQRVWFFSRFGHK